MSVGCCGTVKEKTEKNAPGNSRVDVVSGVEYVRWIVEPGRVAEGGENAGGQGSFLDGQIVVSAKNVSGRGGRDAGKRSV